MKSKKLVLRMPKLLEISALEYLRFRNAECGFLILIESYV